MLMLLSLKQRAQIVEQPMKAMRYHKLRITRAHLLHS